MGIALIIKAMPLPASVSSSWLQLAAEQLSVKAGAQA